MNRVVQVFGRTPVVLPVVHPIGHTEVLNNRDGRTLNLP